MQGTAIEGYAVVSADGMIADGNGHMPDDLKHEPDARFFREGLDTAALVVHGRHSHEEQGPISDQRRRLVVTDHTPGFSAHPSLPNYLALTGGSTFGVTTDCNDCFVTATSIAERIAASGRTWKSYQESMPTPCFVGDAYPYAQKHNPFIYFDDIRTSAECNNIVPFGQVVPCHHCCHVQLASCFAGIRIAARVLPGHREWTHFQRTRISQHIR